MQLAAVLLAAPDIQVLGATATFGNTNLTHVVQNAGSILHFLNADNIPYYAGASGATDKPPMKGAEEGDGAHGDDGTGGVKLNPAIRPPEKESAVEFILDTLRNNPLHSITITATGPLTNIAQAFQKDPKAMQRVAEIVVMGGCTQAMPAADLVIRQGNITAFAEFNFYMAPEDASVVMKSGLPITLLPMNCTQQMSVTPERVKAIRLALLECGDKADQVLGMMLAPALLDRTKFDSDPFMHDVHTALYLVKPNNYRGEAGSVEVETKGHKIGMTSFYDDDHGPVFVMYKIKYPGALFAIFLDSLKSRVAGPRPAFQSSPEQFLHLD